jgi:Arc/MetJ family transcription regulator
MAKTMVDIDDDALREAQAALGTATKKDTINQALAAVVESARRAAAVQAEIERGRSGFYRRLLSEEATEALGR